MLTYTDTLAPAGPFLLEVLLGRASDNPRWQFIQSVKDADEGLRVASRMCSIYDYRLFISPDVGYLYLDWVDDGDGETFSPTWIRK